MAENVNQVIYLETASSERETSRRLLGAKFALYETAPMPVGLGTNTIVNTVRVPKSGFEQFHVYLRVAAAANTVADTLDLYVDCSIDGVFWFNFIHFNQLKGNMAIPLKNLAISQAGSGSYANVSGTQAAGLPPANWFGDTIRLRATLVNNSGLANFSFGVYVSIH